MPKSLKDILADYLEGRDSVRPATDLAEADLAYQRFLSRREAAAMKVKNRLRFAFAMCAAFAALAIGLLLPGLFKNSQPRQFTASAPEGQVVNVTLPDGTAVWLNSSSSLTCSRDFGVRDRAVSLCGEAYFEVTKDESLPMVVSTGSSSVTVLGTRFCLCDYTDDAEASVTLYEGHISFSGIRTGALDLLPGQGATLDKASGRISAATRDTAHPAAWREGILIFEDCTLERICRELSAAYGTPIRISGDGLGSLRFTAEFNVHTQTLSDILDALSLTRHLTFRITEAGVEIY